MISEKYLTFLQKNIITLLAINVDVNPVSFELTIHGMTMCYSVY